MSDDEKAVSKGVRNRSKSSSRDSYLHTGRCCSICGTGTVLDSRGGSVSEYLPCNCESEYGRWVDDGRGGYYVGGGEIVNRDDDHR